ncbi:hypothetical protein [Allobaculum stercoricanis]|uniref:hypothetical protein n=1 Tax=Allobaculum stercoricanis TaxID=174709 RepID=UPI002942DFC9|nr:hypothetical protein [Allobaculum stercoricanis]
MKKNDILPWDLEEGAVMDFVENQILLILKDEDWNENQLQSATDNPIQVVLCETNGVLIFLAQGGPIDTCDFYFNIQECDEKKMLLEQRNLDVRLLLVNRENRIVALKSTTLSLKLTEQIVDILQKQDQYPFMPGEFDANVDGLMATFEPAELYRFKKLEFELR